MSKRWTGIAVIPFLALGLALAGCNGDTDTANTPGAVGNTGDVGNTAGTGEQRDVGDMTGDAAITAQVKSALIADTQVGALEIDVDTVSNVVTLSGEVETEAQKQKAEEIARGVNGVTSVTNNLTVEAGAPAAGTAPH